MAFTIKVNAASHDVDVDDDTPLLWVLRDRAWHDRHEIRLRHRPVWRLHRAYRRQPVRSCLLPVGAVGGRAVTTIEGIGTTDAGAKVQKAWLDLEVIQCGYCQSGQIMSAAALLAQNPHPDDADINAAMAGNICRCGTYVRIREAIKQRRGRQREEAVMTCNARRRLSRRALSCKGGLAGGLVLAFQWPLRAAPVNEPEQPPDATRRPVRAQRVHPHRQCRQDHAGDAAGRDGPGRLHRDRR